MAGHMYKGGLLTMTDEQERDTLSRSRSRSRSCFRSHTHTLSFAFTLTLTYSLTHILSLLEVGPFVGWDTAQRVVRRQLEKRNQMWSRHHAMALCQCLRWYI